VNRGGSWNNNANNCRVANRNNNGPDNDNNNLGFRLVSTTHRKDALSHPRPPAPRGRGDEQGRLEGASTPTHERSGERPPRVQLQRSAVGLRPNLCSVAVCLRRMAAISAAQG
jgi:hypothetical protein